MRKSVKRMKASEIRELSLEELNVKLNDLKKDPKQITEVRRDIARVKTLINEKTAG